MKLPSLRARAVIPFVGVVAASMMWSSVAFGVTASPSTAQTHATTTVQSTAAVAAVSLRSLTRPQIVRRAQAWIAEKVPYSETHWHTDAYGTYRTDCSGYVSMAWHLPTSYVTWTLPQVAIRLSTFNFLRAGDAIDTVAEGHVMLFLRWTDQTHRFAVVDEESHSGTVAHQDTVSLAYLLAHHYTPYRYKGATSTQHDVTGDGHADLLVIKSDHTLWALPGSGYSATLTPVELAVGADQFVQSVVVDNWFGETYPALIALKADGTLWAYPMDGSGRLLGGRRIGVGFVSVNALLAVGDMNRDGHPDLAARDRAGRLWVYSGNGHGGLLRGRTLVGTGFGGVATRLIGATDWNGDHIGDVLAIHPDGQLWFYAGTGTGRVKSGRLVDSGWQNYVTVAVPGDWTSDSVNDLVAINKAGDVMLYLGNNRGGFLGLRKIGSGWTSVVRAF